MNMKKIFLCISISALSGLVACQSSFEKQETKEQKATVIQKTDNQTDKIIYPILDTAVDIKIKGHWVSILSPKNQKIKGNILVLPGWDFSRNDWCEKSSLCQKALQRGYRLLMPEMGRSIYASRLYPETRSDWRVFPTKAWVVEEMLPYLQDSLGVMQPEQANFVLGLSTGARGVALIALAKPALFRAGAALSGDYEQTQMPADRLMIGFYGSYVQFKSRWEGEDNPVFQAKNFKTPLYLGHGKQDKIVPVAQTELFYGALKKANPSLRIHLHLTEAGHDYIYWDSEVENMLDFFEAE